jgi:hypothetical protein
MAQAAKAYPDNTFIAMTGDYRRHLEFEAISKTLSSRFTKPVMFPASSPA